SGLLQYRAEAQSLRQSLGTLLLNIARTGALLVDGDAHEALVASGRSDSPQYAALRGRLLLIQESNQLADAVYTLPRPHGSRPRRLARRDRAPRQRLPPHGRALATVPPEPRGRPRPRPRGPGVRAGWARAGGARDLRGGRAPPADAGPGRGAGAGRAP